MKIIVKETLSASLRLEDMKPGTVFEFTDGIIGLRGRRAGDVFLLTWLDGTDRYEPAKGYLIEPIRKILGTIKEIIVTND